VALAVHQVHRAAEPAADAGAAPEELGHHGLGVAAAGERLPVLAVGGGDGVGVAQRGDRAHHGRLLADGEVEEAADAAAHVLLGRPLLEAADEPHRLEHAPHQLRLRPGRAGCAAGCGPGHGGHLRLVRTATSP
jgi:hypothetical protein